MYRAARRDRFRHDWQAKTSIPCYRHSSSRDIPMSPAPAAPRTEFGVRQCFSLARLLGAALLGNIIAQGAAAVEPAPDWGEVAAIFTERCVMCHSEAAAERGLRLDSYAGAMAGGVSGPVLIPGDPSSSELIRRLNGASRPRMPFLSYPLTAEEIDRIERWIAAGLLEHAPLSPYSGSE
jgi:mono/diheme cytochrome c family protein